MRSIPHSRSLALLLVVPMVVLACGSDQKLKETDDDDGGTTGADTGDGGGDYIDADQDGFTTEDDCNDSNPAISPAATEICDGVDNDCDDSIDEGVKQTFYEDADGDGFGNGSVILESCEQEAGMADNPDDCDDDARAVFPGADEICNDIDDDCDDIVDEDDAIDALTFYADADADGFGDPATVAVACTLPEGHVENQDDCDDTDGDVFPGADEICNDVDDDCDTEIDEDAVDAPTWYIDDDGDGYGLDDLYEVVCDQPEDTAAVGGDCDDDDGAVNPGADEICDGIDNDCDSRTTEPGLVTYEDPDGAYLDVTSYFASGTSSAPESWRMSGDGTYYFCQGTYYAALDLAADINIVGVHGSDETILSTSYNWSVVQIGTNGVDAEISGVTLKNGNGDGRFFGTTDYGSGGGVWCAASADLRIEDVVIKDSVADVGGGIYVEGCDITLSNVLVDGNSADFGGGSAVLEGELTVSDSTYTDNSANYTGGGFYIDGEVADTTAAVQLNYSLIDDNSADFGGGAGVFSAGLGCLGSSSETEGFTDNAASYGGAVFASTPTSLRSVTCDWGTGSTNNSPHDIYLDPYAATFNFGSNESFSCSAFDCY
ncbi:MAG: hypothetical protein H6742_21815 [Alphaproteobacteria bacterium]|nr:hypothetical protein [Alphaproteobacteria bacterium]